MKKDMAASVRARLLNKSKKTQRPFQELLQFYGLERFLYRFSQTEHVEKFLLKGALMLQVWGTPSSRPTRDIDLLGFANNEISTIEKVVKDGYKVAVENDGLYFDSESVTGDPIKEDADYAGVRIKFFGYLEKARIPMQVDVGFGDVVHPHPDEQDFPTILELPAPRLLMYPRETVVAEKFEAMVYLGALNSRFKDFYDVWLLSRNFRFDGEVLASAIDKTFQHRRTPLSTKPIALEPGFMKSERAQKQWIAFVRRSSLERVPTIFDEVRKPLRNFLLPVADSLISGHSFTATWTTATGWAQE